MDTPHRVSTRTFSRMKALALVAIAFGVATLFSAGTILFGADAARELAGAYVPFVVWFNFFAGILYILAGVGLWLRRGWAFGLSVFIAGATAGAALVFGIQVFQGSAFEMRTVGALALRTAFWAGIAWSLHRGARPA